MFSHNHYVPMLKLKMGEVRALEHLAPEDKDNLTPLFEITPVPWDYSEDVPAKTLDQHLSKVVINLKKCGLPRAFFLDFKYVEQEMPGAAVCPMLGIFSAAQAEGMTPIPVVGINRSEDYLKRVEAIALSAGCVCIRLEGDDFDSDDYGDKVLELADRYKCEPGQTDLIIDMGQIPTNGLSPFVVGLKNIIRFFPKLGEWRTLTVASSSFPDSLSSFQANTAEATPRAEYDLWLRLIGGSTTLKRKPAFGDYAVASPAPFDMDPRMMSLGAKIKYTLDEAWLIVKGRGISKGGSKQFHGLAEYIANRDEFKGAEFCYGDKYIADCAIKECGPGNQTTWEIGRAHV